MKSKRSNLGQDSKIVLFSNFESKYGNSVFQIYNLFCMGNVDTGFILHDYTTYEVKLSVF